MKLLDYVENLRRQPMDVRREAVRVWTAIIVGGVVLVYILVLAVRAFMIPTVPAQPSSGLTPPYSETP